MLARRGAGLLQSTTKANFGIDDRHPDWEGHHTPPTSLEGRDEVDYGTPASPVQLLYHEGHFVSLEIWFSFTAESDCIPLPSVRWP